MAFINIEEACFYSYLIGHVYYENMLNFVTFFFFTNWDDHVFAFFFFFFIISLIQI